MKKRVAYRVAQKTWARVRIRVEGAREDLKGLTETMDEWMQDHDGVYAICGIVNAHESAGSRYVFTQTVEFGFDNPDTAFAFKLRFG